MVFIFLFLGGPRPTRARPFATNQAYVMHLPCHHGPDNSFKAPGAHQDLKTGGLLASSFRYEDGLYGPTVKSLLTCSSLHPWLGPQEIMWLSSALIIFYFFV